MSTNYDQMEEIWGLGAIYSEYQIDDPFSCVASEKNYYFVSLSSSATSETYFVEL